MDTDHKGWNALHIAAESASYKIVQLFLSKKGCVLFYNTRIIKKIKMKNYL